METANKLTFLSTKFFTENKREYRITVTISLDDDCHNNMCDWSITADIRWKNEYGIYKEYMGGCCHDEIAKHCPELAKFITLHCCNHYGAPMYPVENGMYHIKNSDKSVAIEYLRISDKEYSKLSEAVDDTIFSDEWYAYKDLDKNLYDHGVVCHKKGAYVIGDRHTNTIEGFWGHLKRTLKGVHHWVSRKHLQRYVDSSAFRYNTKHLSECERFDVLLQNIGHRLRYSQLKNMAA